LAARLGRHLRGEKAQRWHIDALTAQARPAWLLWRVESVPHTPGLECVWSQGLLGQGFRAPIPGFGSSDCRHRCPAHLLHTPELIPGAVVAEMLGTVI
jgi:Uri superfamily endonuclease